MANICIYKIRVSGSKKACYAFIDMMPAYNDKAEVSGEGTDEEFTLRLDGDCKWSPDAYTKSHKDVRPFTQEELEAVQDGDYWEYPLAEKSELLSCEIWCNSKDIDDSGYADYVHYKNGVKISDECPKELHIKRGRDYDFEYAGVSRETEAAGGTAQIKVPCTECVVNFKTGGKYNYMAVNMTIVENDIVRVTGAKANDIGQVVSVRSAEYTVNAASAVIRGLERVSEKLGHVEPFDVKLLDAFWRRHKPKERKEILTAAGFEYPIDSKKVEKILTWRWVEESLRGTDIQTLTEQNKWLME